MLGVSFGTFLPLLGVLLVWGGHIDPLLFATLALPRVRGDGHGTED